MLDDHGVRPPLMAAGINLFGGALGLLHRHVTGAIPIRRNSKDPVYLVTLRAYVAEILKVRDLLYYAEGGRSYSGELKSPKTGLLQAALHADRHELSVVPMAVAYDLVLEDRIISREAARKRSRPFAQEVAEMVRHAVGYQSRAFVTFGKPIALGDYDPESRRDLVAAGASHPGRRRAALQGAADGARRRGHAAASHSRAADFADRRAARLVPRRRRQPRGADRPAGRGRRRRAAQRARRARSGTPAPAGPRSICPALLRAHDRTSASTRRRGTTH